MSTESLKIRAKVRDARRQLDRAREIGLDILRCYVGIALFVRGVLWVAHPEALLAYMARTGTSFGPGAIAHYVIAAHLFGGLLLLVGFYTRLAAVVQLPALAGAVFFTHWGDGLLASDQSLELSALVLYMLIVFSVFGAGPLSLDHAMRVTAKEDFEGTERPAEATPVPTLRFVPENGEKPAPTPGAPDDAVVTAWEGEGGSLRPVPR